MTTQEATEILKQHNEWRRGSEVQMIHPNILGEAIDIMLAFYEGTQKTVSPQDTPAIEDKIKAIDKEIKEREKYIADAILRHKVWTGQIG